MRSYKKMIKILFVCHGNICRSPMAEFIMKDLVQKAGLAAEFHIESAATSREAIGNLKLLLLPPAPRKSAIRSIRPRGASWPSMAFPARAMRRGS